MATPIRRLLGRSVYPLLQLGRVCTASATQVASRETWFIRPALTVAANNNHSRQISTSSTQRLAKETDTPESTTGSGKLRTNIFRICPCERYLHPSTSLKVL